MLADLFVEPPPDDHRTVGVSSGGVASFPKCLQLGVALLSKQRHHTLTAKEHGRIVQYGLLIKYSTHGNVETNPDNGEVRNGGHTGRLAYSVVVIHSAAETEHSHTQRSRTCGRNAWTRRSYLKATLCSLSTLKL